MPDDPKLPDIDAGIEDVEFSRAAVKALYGGVVAEQRWSRANSEIRFDDVVQELTGKWGRAISCPFHGTDSTPSFYLFAQTMMAIASVAHRRKATMTTSASPQST